MKELWDAVPWLILAVMAGFAGYWRGQLVEVRSTISERVNDALKYGVLGKELAALEEAERDVVDRKLVSGAELRALRRQFSLPIAATSGGPGFSQTTITASARYPARGPAAKRRKKKT